MEDDGLLEFMKVFLEDAKKNGRLNFDLERPEARITGEDVGRFVRTATPPASFCRGEAYKIARTLVDTGFVREISIQQFIAIVEIIYQLQTKNATGQSI